MELSKLEKARRRLLDEIAQEARDTAFWTGREKFSDAVMTAIAEVRREKYVMTGDEVVAYVNRPQRIGQGQTISQPYIVALMTDLLDLQGHEKILEIGAGSGYQAAVLAEVARRGSVYTVEIVETLAENARRRLADLGYANIHVRHGDGFRGWPEEAPFDSIIVTAAPERIPERLIHQLRKGGRMVVPVGRAHDRQTLMLVVKDEAGKVAVDQVLPVVFVPMVHGKDGDAN